MSNLLDVFMPEDLCARCGERDPLQKYFLGVENSGASVRLHFCSEICLSKFVVGMEAAQGMKDG